MPSYPLLPGHGIAPLDSFRVNAGGTDIESYTPSGVSDGDKGDITVSSGGTVFTIDAGVVTLAKMAADGAAVSVLGRAAGTVGARADIVAGADGDVLRRDAGVVGFGSIPEASVAGLVTDLGNKVDTSRQVATTNSITGGGNLSADRTLQLVNDSAAPGANQVYGTDAGGVKGWKADPAGGGLTHQQILARSLRA